MHAEFWHSRWRSGQTGFHQTSVDDYLKRHWPALGLERDARVFVPLCGKSVDLLWLRERGHRVVGVELSEIALQEFCMEHGVPARRRLLPDFDDYLAMRLELKCGDLFALTPESLRRVQGVYDRAALVSWAHSERLAYVRKLTALTAPGAETLLITLEYPQPELSGPPFSVTAKEVARLYGLHHSIEELERRNILDREPRLRARGVSRLEDVCYRITRL